LYNAAEKGRMLEQDIVNKMKGMHAQYLLEISTPRAGQVVLLVDKKALRTVIDSLKKEGFGHLSTITGLESGGAVELLYHLAKEGIMLAVKVKLPLDDLSLPTITDIILGASLYEREIHDLFGVKIEGHPDLKPLILPDDWPDGVYPLRKSRTEEKGEE
jgi:membrane-bound hydrogenase subunit beta